jgi:gliding motility-associated-like protein
VPLCFQENLQGFEHWNKSHGLLFKWKTITISLCISQPQNILCKTGATHGSLLVSNKLHAKHLPCLTPINPIMTQRLLLCLLCFGISLTRAQNRDNTWFFGSSLGMQFNGGGMSIIPAGTSPFYSPYAAASYSDPATGNMLFYTNGSTVYNRRHQVMDNGDFINGSQLAVHCYIVPHPGIKDQYFIISSSSQNSRLYYAIIDMNMDNGFGGVVSKVNPINIAKADKAFTVVRDLYDDGYWLITHMYGQNQFICYRIGKNGIETPGVASMAGPIMPGGDGFEYIRGKMTSNSTGTEFLFSNGTNEDYFLQLYAFDKRCGKVTFKTNFQPDILQAYAPLAYAAFSPDDKLVYAAWFYISTQNFLYQYNLNDPDPDATRVRLHAQLMELGDMQVGPDGKIYMAAVENGMVSSKISVINNPNVAGAGCDFRLYQYSLSNNPSHFTEHFIEYIRDVSPQRRGYAKPKITFTNSCEGEPVSFAIADSFVADSFRWHFGDGNSSTLKTPFHKYSITQDYPVTFTWYMCNRRHEITDTLKLRKKPLVNLGNDSTLCAGSGMILNAPPNADGYRWNTGDSTPAIIADTPGTYRVSVRNGGCIGEGEIKISYYPPVSAMLGDEFFICEKDNELVKLDAGEGFINYKWTPTGDTTQWIIVAESGEYFVVVKDFRGCNGNDGTVVRRRCPVSVYFPNVFTPNKDNINDTYAPKGVDVQSFHLTIFNCWGSKVFETHELQKTWDGTLNGVHAPAGVYIYTAEYSGFVNKRLHQFNSSGNITLMH